MRYVLIFVGASVVAWLLAKGIRAFISERNKTLQNEQHSPEQ